MSSMLVIFFALWFHLGSSVGSIEAQKALHHLFAICPDDEYYNQYGNLSTSGCHACPEHASCNGLDLLSIDDYWIRFGSDQTPNVQTYYCPLQRCLKTNDCSENRKNYSDNILCGECLEGYSEWGNVCSESETNIGLTAAFVIIIILFTGFFYFCSQIAIGTTRSFLYLIQIGFIVSGLPDSNLFGMQYLDFLFNFNLLAVFPASPIALSPIQRIWVRIIIPLLVFGALLIQFVLHAPYIYFKRKYSEEDNAKPFRLPVYMYTRALSNWVFFAFTPVTYGLFSALTCVDVTKLNSTGGVDELSVNYYFPAIDCHEDNYKTSAAILLYCVLPLTLLVPLVAGIVIVLNDNRHRMQGVNCKKYCGQWFEVYASRRQMFEILVLLRRIAIVVLVTIFSTLDGTEYIIVVAICGANFVADLILGPYDKDTPEEYVGSNGNYFQAFANLFILAIAIVRYLKPLPYSTDYDGEWLILAVMLWAATLIYLCWRVWLGQKQCRRCLVRQQSYEAGDENEDIDD